METKRGEARQVCTKKIIKKIVGRNEKNKAQQVISKEQQAVFGTSGVVIPQFILLCGTFFSIFYITIQSLINIVVVTLISIRILRQNQSPFSSPSSLLPSLPPQQHILLPNPRSIHNCPHHIVGREQGKDRVETPRLIQQEPRHGHGEQPPERGERVAGREDDAGMPWTDVQVRAGDPREGQGREARPDGDVEEGEGEGGRGGGGAGAVGGGGQEEEEGGEEGACRLEQLPHALDGPAGGNQAIGQVARRDAHQSLQEVGRQGEGGQARDVDVEGLGGGRGGERNVRFLSYHSTKCLLW